MDINTLLKEIRKRSVIAEKELTAQSPPVPFQKDLPRDMTSVGSSTNILQRARLTSHADIAVVTALTDPEKKQITKAFPATWATEMREGAVFDVAEIAFGNKTARVVVGVQNSMGMVPAAILVSKVIRGWSPRLMVMTGICAGIRSEVNIGDVVVAKQVFDYGSGKVKNGKFVPDYQPVALDSSLCNCLLAFANNKKVLQGIRDKWNKTTGKPKTDLAVHVGDFGSGAAVVADKKLVEEIKGHKRSLKAIDMEGYGFARAASDTGSQPTRFILAKGVQDFADRFKGDEFREYAAFVSAWFLRKFLEKHWGDIA